MNISTAIIKLRRKFIKNYKFIPDIVVLTDGDLDKLLTESINVFGDYFCGMKIELGDKTECKLNETIQLL